MKDDQELHEMATEIESIKAVIDNMVDLIGDIVERLEEVTKSSPLDRVIEKLSNNDSKD